MIRHPPRSTLFPYPPLFRSKGNDAVLLEPYNEPYPDSNSDTVAAWTCWRDGGTCRGQSFQAAGMQELVNAIRATGGLERLPDRKSTRLNSSHGYIPYAVFCF